MKVYIVASGEYPDYHIDAVFLDKQMAMEYCARMDTIRRNHHWGVYKCDADTEKPIEIVGAEVEFPSGDVTLMYGPYDEEAYDEAGEYFNSKGVDGWAEVNIHYNPNRDAMLKAAGDRAAMIRARDEGLHSRKRRVPGLSH